MTESTRARIQAVALELFTENGYEKTSLREIAERLGVTKAALYYHFKSKDEIVSSFVEDRLRQLDELIAWAETVDDRDERRRELIQRYADGFFSGDQHLVMRFFEQNQSTVKSLNAGVHLRDRMMRLVDFLGADATDPADQLRTTLALFAIHGSWFALQGADITIDERRDVALEVAGELLAPRG